MKRTFNNHVRGSSKVEKVGQVMREFKRGTLRSGSVKGPQVTSQKQALAIAMSEAGIRTKKMRGY